MRIPARGDTPRVFVRHRRAFRPMAVEGMVAYMDRGDNDWRGRGFFWSEIADVMASHYTPRHGWQSNSTNASEKAKTVVGGTADIRCPFHAPSQNQRPA